MLGREIPISRYVNWRHLFRGSPELFFSNIIKFAHFMVFGQINEFGQIFGFHQNLIILEKFFVRFIINL